MLESGMFLSISHIGKPEILFGLLLKIIWTDRIYFMLYYESQLFMYYKAVYVE